jgi:hypothetical protein
MASPNERQSKNACRAGWQGVPTASAEDCIIQDLSAFVLPGSCLMPPDADDLKTGGGEMRKSLLTEAK